MVQQEKLADFAGIPGIPHVKPVRFFLTLMRKDKMTDRFKLTHTNTEWCNVCANWHLCVKLLESSQLKTAWAKMR